MNRTGSSLHLYQSQQLNHHLQVCSGKVLPYHEPATKSKCKIYIEVVKNLKKYRTENLPCVRWE